MMIQPKLSEEPDLKKDQSKSSMLLYLHGFNSSPQSLKAKIMQQYCQEFHPHIKLVMPQLPNYPKEAADHLQSLVEKNKENYNIGVMGSSLGGYLATWLNAHYQTKSVLINPAVRPYELLSGYLGEQTNPYTNQKFNLENKHIRELKNLEIECITNKNNFWVLQQKGDEVLDYRQAVEKYENSQFTLEEGGNHSFVGFERFSAEIIQFLDL